MQQLEDYLADCKSVIDEEVGFYLMKYGGNQNDIYQEAYVAAIQAIHHFDPNLSDSHTAWVRLCVRGKLQNYRRHQIATFITIASPDKFKNLVQQEPSHFNSIAFFAELTEDAKTVLEIIFDPDPNFWRPKRSQRNRWISLLTSHLRHANWTTARITSAFSCIRNALA